MPTHESVINHAKKWKELPMGNTGATSKKWMNVDIVPTILKVIIKI